MKPCPTIYIAFTEGRYGTHISKWATAPFDGATSYSARPEAVTDELIETVRDLLELHVAHTGPFNEAREIAHWQREEQLGNGQARPILAAYDALSKVSPLIVGPK